MCTRGIAVSLILTICGAIAVQGCAGSKTEQSEPTAVVVPAYEGGVWQRYVRIRCVAEVGRFKDECARSRPYSTYVYLTPGHYDFDVQFVSGAVYINDLALDLLTIPADAVAAARNQSSRRNISFAVEAGRTYAIHFDPDAGEYFVNVRESTSAKPPRPRLSPPRGAQRCVPASAAPVPNEVCVTRESPT